MPRKKKPTRKSLSPAFPLPDGVALTPEAQEVWARFTRLLPLNSGPRLLFVLVDSPTLRRRLADHVAAALQADGHTVARLEFTQPYYLPLQEIFDAAAEHPDARFLFLFGLERSLISADHRLGALADLNIHRDQIHRRLSCPLVIWTTEEAFTDLGRYAVDFIAWRGGVFTFTDPSTVVETPYRQHVIDSFGKLTLYSATSDAPLAVDLERVFVKLTATERRMRVGVWENGRMGEGEAPAESSDSPARPFSHAPIPEEVTVTLSITDAFRAHPCLTIVGAPGSGKTTLLKYLALTFARRQAKERLELDEERLPVFITLRDFNRFLGEKPISPQLLPDFLNAHIKAIAPHLNLPDDFFSRQLDAGKCVVLLDGLDEVADPLKRARVAEAVAEFVRHYRGNRFVVTSRPRGYEGEAKQRLAPLCADCTIRDFDDDGMAEFARCWYTAVTVDQMGDTLTARDTAANRAEDLLKAVRADVRVKALARNPLLLSVLAMVHQRGVGLPQRRAKLYDECTDMLLGYWDQIKGGEAARELANYGGLTRTEKRTLLEPVALWFHERGEQGLEADKKVIAQQFQEIFGDDERKAQHRAALFLRVIDERAGLLVERETGVYAFAHLTFQEYLAARAIADREDCIEYTLQHLHDPWWREVILLEVGHLSDVRHFGRRARKLTSDLIRAIRNAGSWQEDVLKRDLLFAARCLCDVGQLGVEDELRQNIMDELITLWRMTPYEPQRDEVVDIFAYAMPTGDGKRVLAELMALTEDADATVRRAAVETLGSLDGMAATEAVVRRLVALVEDKNTHVGWAAALALGHVREAAATEETLSRLIALTENADATVRRWAAKALGGLEAAAATEAVLNRLAALTLDENRDVRYRAAEALGDLGPGAATEVVLSRLVALTEDADIPVRFEATRALGRLGPPAATEAVLSRLMALREGEDIFLEHVAEEALDRLGKGTETTHQVETTRDLIPLSETPEDEREAVLGDLVALSEDTYSGRRAMAARGLQQLGIVTEAVLQRLLVLIEDEDEHVCHAAAEALGRLGAGAATEAVLTRLITLLEKADINKRYTAAWVLGRLGSAAAPEMIWEQLAQFWQSQLTITELRWVVNQYERVCDIAYEELRQITGLRGAKSG